MLSLHIDNGEPLFIGHNIAIVARPSETGNRVQLAITAPRPVKIRRAKHVAADGQDPQRLLEEIDSANKLSAALAGHKQKRSERGPEECRRCDGCQYSNHHWLAWGRTGDGTPWGRFTHCCKHCSQLGTECPVCYGDGIEPGTALDDCQRCAGEGVVFSPADRQPAEGANGE